MSLKRIFDFCFSVFLIIVLSPLLIIIALAIKFTSNGPVIFKQKRLGKNGREFEIYKFRTMVQNAEKKGNGVYTLKDDPRVTKVGKILRKTSLDEMPQLFNIFKNEMSFVGPRPTLTYHPYQYNNYSDEQKKRFEVKPGVTGLAQLSGRKELPWDERIKYDIEYVKNYSFFYDIRLIFKTIPKVLKMEANYNTKDQLNNEGDN